VASRIASPSVSADIRNQASASEPSRREASFRSLIPDD
jgi:hypothetical protein